MSTPVPAPTPAPEPEPELAVREVVLAQARELARAGRYAEAEELLDGPWNEGGRDVAALDLKARIHAQQGHLDEADRCWAEVAELAPGHRGAAEGRRRIAAVRARAATGGFTGRTLTARFALRAAAAVVALLAFVMLADLWADGGPRPEPAANPSAAAPAPPAPAPAPSTEDVLAGLRLDGPGVRVQRRPGEIAVTFDRGLFRDGATLSRQGRAVLDGLGERLRPYNSRITVAVIGHTDRSAVRPGGEYASNVELGTVRATVVREVLRSSARIPTSRFTVSTLAGMLPPYPGQDSGDARNRTVSLRVSAAGAR
ncbi:hypothetical protein [Actinomadura rugatobispora]|uniref:OmpA-like domain-containing protein n=1 Tax=Actinomadura rugatobispora TaxID=1994 RepID=A0ABW1A9Q7_9ACTN|nr:hypothetical protein GCM10010200_017460 [Actinomadura rugatobispora]